MAGVSESSGSPLDNILPGAITPAITVKNVFLSFVETETMFYFTPEFFRLAGLTHSNQMSETFQVRL